jgi:hypothetical protein
VDAKDIKCPLEWRRKHETIFSIVNIGARYILKIIGSQIETEIKISLSEILTNLKGNVIDN